MSSRYSFVTVLSAWGIAPPNKHTEESGNYTLIGIAYVYSLHF